MCIHAANHQLPLRLIFLLSVLNLDQLIEIFDRLIKTYCHYS